MAGTLRSGSVALGAELGQSIRTKSQQVMAEEARDRPSVVWGKTQKHTGVIGSVGTRSVAMAIVGRGSSVVAWVRISLQDSHFKLKS